MSLVLVANRAPIRNTEAGWAPALGGLASALLPVLAQRGGAWVAMSEPGDDAPSHQAYPEGEPAFEIHRVPLGEAEFEGYYQGMSNRVLWPLSHYLVELVEPERAFLEAYRTVNQRFAEAALKAASPSEEVTFWVQDYHMMRVPELLRRGRPDARIGVFWHVPWPAPEVFRILPSSRELLRGVLGANLVGFHTEGYAENFRESARDLLGATINGDAVVFEGRTIRVQAHPIGIDVKHFAALAEQPEAKTEAGTFKAELGGSRLVVGIDRLDYTKGLLLRLEAFERFLELYPDLHRTVTFFQVATPSRTGVPAYDQLKRDVDEAVGRINGRFSEGAWVPIRYRYRSFDQPELAVMYAAADVAYVTPLRDGMNLVSHEFVAVNASAGIDPGVLVLSELTGAADYLKGAVLVNPYDADGMAHALHEALTLGDADKRRRLVDMYAAVQRLDVHAWADHFLYTLGRT
ncbi:MAG: trehalose-6-phosphate synthase [Rubricoccaceae bacterium]